MYSVGTELVVWRGGGLCLCLEGGVDRVSVSVSRMCLCPGGTVSVSRNRPVDRVSVSGEGGQLRGVGGMRATVNEGVAWFPETDRIEPMLPQPGAINRWERERH